MRFVISIPTIPTLPTLPFLPSTWRALKRCLEGSRLVRIVVLCAQTRVVNGKVGIVGIVD